MCPLALVALVRFAVATPDETKLDGVETRLLDADGLELIGKDRQNAAEYVGGNSDLAKLHHSAVSDLMGSAADTVIFPVQDVLGLDNRARMNVPGTAEGNWGWRLPPGALKPAHAKWLRRMTELTDRLPT